VAGFLAAALVSVQNETEINWKNYIPTALASVIGVAIVRTGTKQAAEHVDTITSHIDDIDRSIDSLVENVTRLNREKETIHTYDMRYKIDELLLDDLDTFAEARETLNVKFGITHYTDIMSHFATGERYLNRVWSCSADGYVDEVNEYLGRAEEQFREVQQKFQAVKAQMA
jgi:hypothetical protein